MGGCNSRVTLSASGVQQLQPVLRSREEKNSNLKKIIEFSSHVFNSELLEAVDIDVVATELHACINSSNPAILRYEHSKLTY